MDNLSKASCKVTPSLCHTSFPLKAELEILRKGAFCRWQHLHMMYITFREPERLYSVHSCHWHCHPSHYQQSEKVKKYPALGVYQWNSWPRDKMSYLTLPSANQGITGTSPESKSSTSSAWKGKASSLSYLKDKLHLYGLLIYLSTNPSLEGQARSLFNNPYTDSSNKIIWEAEQELFFDSRIYVLFRTHRKSWSSGMFGNQLQFILNLLSEKSKLKFPKKC